MKTHGVMVCGVLVAAAAAMVAIAGDLNPPPGPVAATAKPLQEVEPRIGIRSVSGFLGPITIDEPGSYHLLENIRGLANFDAIQITASDVTLDLNGFGVVAHPFVDSPVGIRIGINGSPVERVAVMNGSVSGFDDTGIDGEFAAAVLIESVRVTDCEDGIEVRNGSQVRRSVANDNEVRGIQVSFGSLATGCTARGNGFDGLQAFRSIIRDSTSSNNNRGFFASEGSLIDCIATGNDSTGITATSNSFVNGCAVVDSPARFSISGSSTIINSNN